MVWYIVRCMYNLQNFVILSKVLSFYHSKHSICLISNNSSSSWWFIGKESACQYRRCRFDPWVKKISRRRKWKLTPIFLPGKFHGQRSLVGYGPQGHKESVMTEVHFAVVVVVWLLSCVQLFCNPVDRSPPGSSVHGIFQARILE